MALFKKAYARGSMKALLDTGAVKIANEELAAELADQASEKMPEEPVEEVPPETTAELAANLVDLANSLQESANNAADAAETVAASSSPAAPAAKSDEEKAAAVQKAAALFLRKLGQGSTITGDRVEQQNTPAQATTGEAKMDQQQRPENYANVGEAGVGAQEAAGKGKVGDEEKVEGIGMGPVAVDGSNSATEVVSMKAASIRDVIKAAARKQANATVGVGTKQVDATTGEGQLDDKNRPGGAAYANKGVDGVGSTDMRVPANARIGDEKAHPDQENHAGSTNTVVQETKVGEDEAYIQRFKQVGAKYANRLPFFLDTHQKVAAVQYLMSLPPQEREVVVSRMEKTAELPEGLKNYMAAKGEGEGKSEEKAEEKKDEENKNQKDETKKSQDEEKNAAVSAARNDLLSRLRRLQA